MNCRRDEGRTMGTNGLRELADHAVRTAKGSPSTMASVIAVVEKADQGMPVVATRHCSSIELVLP